MKYIRLIALALLVCVTLSACSSSSDNGKEGTSDSKKINQEATQPKKTGNDLINSIFDELKSKASTVKLARIYDEDTDPNNLIGKQGQYQYAGSFYDTRSGYEPTDDNLNPIAIEDDLFGTDAGGAVEVFVDKDDAEARGEYLGQYQTGLVQAGAYRVINNVVLRVSPELKASEQNELLDIMENVVNRNL